MKFFQSITLTPEHCPKDLYGRVVGMAPNGQRGSLFHLEAKAGDEDSGIIVKKIVALCTEHGLDKIPGAYSHMVDRVYEQSDFEAAPLLMLETQFKMFHGAQGRDAEGRLSLPIGQAKPSIKVASIYPQPWVVVSSEVRKILESEHLAGLQFGEVLVRARSRTPSVGFFWELRSEVVLPKMLNSIPYPETPFPSYGIVDPPFHTVEPHYRAGDLKSLGRFDAARTFEPLGGPYPYLIVSQRLYQHCLRSKIRLRVRPVRIEQS
ncbi:MAG TPA: hypothetical protein VG167_05035 [Verrucomicrobiae bacterium]|nr:hypothetical protein [Verrucomicrobiae bacterium]